MATVFCNVYLNRKEIDCVSMSYSSKMTKAQIEADVKESLVNHDGYDSDINVRCVTPLTSKDYQLFVNYGHGWELETTEESWEALKEQEKCYRTNCPQYPTKKKTVRISIFA